VTFVISATPLAADGIDLLRGPVREAFDAKLREMKSRGCKACGYRLSGEIEERICCVHLRDAYRLLACFPDSASIVIVLVAEHDRSESDVYRLLAELLEIPMSEAERTKPPCCDEEGRPPFADDLLDRFESVSSDVRRELVKRIRR
jgi:mRNA-degrading endonuclease RelE of RelBE toxin-antitoxin system